MLKPEQILDLYFPEVRAWLIQAAAVMDRLDRAEGPSMEADPRLDLYRRSLDVLAAPGRSTDRAKRVQEIFSDTVSYDALPYPRKA